MIRALTWVLGGLALLALLVVATAPELLADVRVAGGLASLAFAAAVPGLLLLGYLAVRRRGRHDQPGAGRPSDARRTPLLPTRRANLTPEDLRALREADHPHPTDAED
ncbi:hypothetical protein FTX61_07430 [Nitriliruptoraceae bacterium ZYF776]|nr:hypothetical protein [Profundirhabdus halotolerans]